MFGRTYSDLGPVVGQINGEDIRANQLERRGYDWRMVMALHPMDKILIVMVNQLEN